CRPAPGPYDARWFLRHQTLAHREWQTHGLLARTLQIQTGTSTSSGRQQLLSFGLSCRHWSRQTNDVSRRGRNVPTPGWRTTIPADRHVGSGDSGRSRCDSGDSPPVFLNFLTFPIATFALFSHNEPAYLWLRNLFPIRDSGRPSSTTRGPCWCWPA